MTIQHRKLGLKDLTIIPRQVQPYKYNIGVFIADVCNQTALQLQLLREGVSSSRSCNVTPRQSNIILSQSSDGQ